MGRPANTLERIRTTLLRRKQVMLTGCWLWPGTKDQHGYGVIRLSGHMIKVHRLASEFFGPIEGIGPSVLHHCDTPACFYPRHLFRGTQGDNMRDAAQKGRTNGKPGFPRPHPTFRRLSPENVQQIRALAPIRKGKVGSSEGLSLRELARRFGVSYGTIIQVVNGRTYKEAQPS